MLERGGRLPVTGRHSVMLRPDSVRRVRPPKTTMPKTEVAERRSQVATPLVETSGHEDVGWWVVVFALMLWLRALRGDVGGWVVVVVVVVVVEDWDRDCSWELRKALRKGVWRVDL